MNTTIRDDLLLAGPAAGPACPRCAGPLFADVLDLAPYWCLHCGERFLSDMSLIRRAPTEDERSARKRYIYSRADRR